MTAMRTWSARMRQRVETVVVRSVGMLAAQDGQAEWVQQIMVLGIVVLIAAAIFLFWKGGGLTWINTQLTGITQY
ncbi:MAG: hypothetical protein ACP5QO_16500 [Clostridia bacterium]